MKVLLSKKADKQFRKLDKHTQKEIGKYIDELESLQNPRSRGKGLVGNLGGYWRYRVGDYRLICEIIDDELIILVLEVGHRKNVY